MANEKHLAILKQGAEVWNKWRVERLVTQNDFSEADLSESNLSGAYLSIVNLSGANLSEAFIMEANLEGANLSEVNFWRAYLVGAQLQNAQLLNTNLSEADLGRVNLAHARLTGANLSLAKLGNAYLEGVFLNEADLSQADLYGAEFFNADVRSCNFSNAIIGRTKFGNCDLSQAIGLGSVIHRGPSTIGLDTITKSKGIIPEAFLQGCGLSDWEIEAVKLYNPELSNETINRILYKVYDLRASQALQISPLFISYSHEDGAFLHKLENQLNKEGIRFWRDVHDMKSGRIETQIDLAIRQNPTVLLILSEHSLKSDWVEHEVRIARELENEMGRDVLCPIALDNDWKGSPWPKRVMEQIMEYNILDFSEWEEDEKFDGMFRKLIDGLELFYKG